VLKKGKKREKEIYEFKESDSERKSWIERGTERKRHRGKGKWKKRENKNREKEGSEKEKL